MPAEPAMHLYKTHPFSIAPANKMVDTLSSLADVKLGRCFRKGINDVSFKSIIDHLYYAPPPPLLPCDIDKLSLNNPTNGKRPKKVKETSATLNNSWSV
jgi:hypothetical protein